MRGLYKGSLLALVGVSNGSIQFAAYEEIKRRRTDIKRKLVERERSWQVADEKLVRLARGPLTPVQYGIHPRLRLKQACRYRLDLSLPGGSSADTSESPVGLADVERTQPFAEPAKTHPAHPHRPNLPQRRLPCILQGTRDQRPADSPRDMYDLCRVREPGVGIPNARRQTTGKARVEHHVSIQRSLPLPSPPPLAHRSLWQSQFRQSVSAWPRRRCQAGRCRLHPQDSRECQ